MALCPVKSWGHVYLEQNIPDAFAQARFGLLGSMCSCWCHWTDVPGKWLAMWLVTTTITERAGVLVGSPLSDSTSLCVSPPLRGESCEDAFPLPISLQSSLEMRNTFHSQVERCGTEKHRLWNSNLSFLTLAVWPWAIYLNLPEPQFPHLYKWCLLPCRVDVGIKGRILDLPGM